MDRNAKEKSRLGFDRQAAQYDISGDGEHARSMYPHVLKRLECLPFQSLLDVGCGTGVILSRIPPRADLMLAGIDLSPNMIEVARQRLKGRADLRVGDAERLPWPEAAFEVILCLDSFHHYPQPYRALAEVRRVIKPGGRFILADLWQPAPIRHLFNLLIPLSKDGDVHVYSRGEIRALLKDNGFTEIQWESINQMAFIATATISERSIIQ